MSEERINCPQPTMTQEHFTAHEVEITDSSYGNMTTRTIRLTHVHDRKELHGVLVTVIKTGWAPAAVNPKSLYAAAGKLWDPSRSVLRDAEPPPAPEPAKTCKHKKTDMTPCVVTDGPSAYDDSKKCVGCGRPPALTRVALPGAGDPDNYPDVPF